MAFKLPDEALRPLSEARDQLLARWRDLAPRERHGAVAAGVAVLLLLVWLLAIAPAWHTLRDTPAKLERLVGELSLQPGIRAVQWYAGDKAQSD